MSKKNIAYQFKRAIDEAFSPGSSKHSEKQTGDSIYKIYSFNERKNLITLTSTFAKYLKENHKEIRYVKDIRAEHWQNFLNTKKEDCSTATLKNYVSRIGKIETITNEMYNIKTIWHKNVMTPVSQKTIMNQKLRTQQMSKEHMDKILEAGKSLKSEGVRGVELAYRFGLRVHEITRLSVKDIDFERKEMIVKGKGGRIRVLQLEDRDIRLLNDAVFGKDPKDKLVPIKSSSVNQYLNRTMKRIGIKKDYPDTAIHSIRKLKAQELWDYHRKNGLSKRETAERVSDYLGHGKNRADIIQIYVQNTH